MSDPLMIPLFTNVPPPASGNTAQHIPEAHREAIAGSSSVQVIRLSPRNMAPTVSSSIRLDSFLPQGDGNFLFQSSKGFFDGSITSVQDEPFPLSYRLFQPNTEPSLSLEDIPFERVTWQETQSLSFKVDPKTYEIIVVPPEGEIMTPEQLDAGEMAIEEALSPNAREIALGTLRNLEEEGVLD